MKVIQWGLLALLLSTESWAFLPLSEGVRVIDPEKKHLRMLASHAELVIDHVNSLGYEVHGPQGLEVYLTKNQIQFVPDQDSETKPRSKYPTPEATIKTMKDLAQKYPKIITLIEIGMSTEGRPLMFAKLTAPAKNGRPMNDRPEFKYIANMHGDEIVGRELMVRLIEDLASNYKKDSRITQILDTIQVYIMPSMNPDGAARQRRYNAQGADLNRSFPDWTTSDNQNTTDNRPVEVQAIQKFQAQHNFKLSANFHGGAEVVNYPWDATPEPFPLENFVKMISLDYSKRVPYIYASDEFPQGITNGFDWYIVQGGMQDWSFQWFKDLQVTIELSALKWPSYSTVQGYYDSNREALLSYIEDVLEVE